MLEISMRYTEQGEQLLLLDCDIYIHSDGGNFLLFSGMGIVF